MLQIMKYPHILLMHFEIKQMPLQVFSGVAGLSSFKGKKS